MPTNAQLTAALKALIVAMESSVEAGCTDRLDCWDGADGLWYNPLADAKQLLESPPRPRIPGQLPDWAQPHSK